MYSTIRPLPIMTDPDHQDAEGTARQLLDVSLCQHVRLSPVGLSEAHVE